MLRNHGYAQALLMAHCRGGHDSAPLRNDKDQLICDLPRHPGDKDLGNLLDPTFPAQAHLHQPTPGTAPDRALAWDSKRRYNACTRRWAAN